MVVQMLQHVIMMLMLHVITDLVFYQMGCTDSLACNYDPSANCDDGSCYNLLASIQQDGDSLSAVTTPVGLMLIGITYKQR